VKQTLYILLALAIMLPTSLIRAQAPPTRPVELPDGTVVDLPEDWEFEELEGGAYLFTSSDAYLLVMLPDVTAASYADLAVPPTPAELLIILSTNEIIDHAISEEDVDLFDGGARYAFEDEVGQGNASVIEWNDGLLFVEFYGPNEDFAAVEDQVNALLAQIAPAEAVECFVSAADAGGAPMRLGPGINRGEYTSLRPEDGEVRVIGQANADDGSLWWRVEENYDAVNELWVADSKVVTSGDCDNVGQAAAPALIPPQGPVIVQTPASQPDTGGDTGTGGETGGEIGGDTGGDASLIPANGSWFLAMSPTLMISCSGGDTVRVPSDMGFMQGNVRISNATATSLTMSDASGSLFFTGTNGFYTVENSFDDLYVVLRLRVSSPTQMSGEYAVAFLSLPCSGTVPVSFTYQG
jgi:hypothetical protein